MSTIYNKLSSKYRQLGLIGFIKAACKAFNDAIYYQIVFCKNKVLRHFISLPHINADLVLSLGPACRPAHYLRELGLRKFSSPFDWMMCYDLKTIINFFENGFDPFFKNWEIESTGKGKCWYVRDKDTGMLSMHHFDRAYPADYTYPSFINKMRKRFKNTIHHIETSGTICFVTNREHEKDALNNFLFHMDRIFPGHKFITINIITNKNEYFEKIKISNNIEIYNIYFTDINKDGPDSQTSWLGNVEKWHKYISCINLSDSLNKN